MTAVRPKDAATLILVRRGPAGDNVLMGRRAAGHDFMPSKWVFPGGRVERADHAAPFAADLAARDLARLSPIPSRARAFALAAVRETFEETGLLVARPAAARPGAGPWRAFRQQGALPDLSGLRYVARAVTPAGLPKRFDARFFLASADRLLSPDPLPDCGEFDQIAWAPLDRIDDYDLPDITRLILTEARAALADPDRPVPLIRTLRGRRDVAYA